MWIRDLRITAKTLQTPFEEEKAAQKSKPEQKRKTGKPTGDAGAVGEAGVAVEHLQSPEVRQLLGIPQLRPHLHRNAVPGGGQQGLGHLLLLEALQLGIVVLVADGIPLVALVVLVLVIRVGPATPAAAPMVGILALEVGIVGIDPGRGTALAQLAVGVAAPAEEPALAAEGQVVVGAADHQADLCGRVDGWVGRGTGRENRAGGPGRSDGVSSGEDAEAWGRIEGLLGVKPGECTQSEKHER